MNTHKHKTIGDTIYFWFGSNATSGEGDDGATPVFDVRLAGAAAGAAPVLSGSGTLLTHVDFPAGAHEVAIVATVGNGFVAGNTYAVFVSLLVNSVNPTGVAGEFTLAPIISNVTEIGGGAQSATDLKDFADAGYDPGTNKVQGVVLVDTTTTNTDMVGTDGANTVVPMTATLSQTEHDSTQTAVAAISTTGGQEIV